MRLTKAQVFTAFENKGLELKEAPSNLRKKGRYIVLEAPCSEPNVFPTLKEANEWLQAYTAPVEEVNEEEEVVDMEPERPVDTKKHHRCLARNYYLSLVDSRGWAKAANQFSKFHKSNRTPKGFAKAS